jgi:hypothetical protein
LAAIALVLPTMSFLFMAACNTARAPIAVSHASSALTIQDYGITSIVPDPNEDLVTVNYDSGVTVAIHTNFAPGPNDPEMTATSSDGSSAVRTQYQGWPIVSFGPGQYGALFFTDSAADELDKWLARGNTAAFALVALEITNTAQMMGATDLNTFDRAWRGTNTGTDSTGTGTDGGPLPANLFRRRPTATACTVTATATALAQLNPPDGGANGGGDGQVFDFPADECAEQPGDACLLQVAHSGWYPCAKNAILALLSVLGGIWVCGACGTFLSTAIPGLLGYATNPIGWIATLLGAASCVGCAIAAWGAFVTCKNTFLNCFAVNPAPQQAQCAQ